MQYQHLEIVSNGRAATVYLNRPEVRNAFNEIMISEITRAFTELGAAKEMQVIVLAAKGKAFCAGADLSWMKKMAAYSHAENVEDAGQLAAMLKTIHDCPKPVIAQVQGDCYAGGMGLVAACDVAVAASDVGFCLSEVKLGLIPATISPYVINSMGHNAARRYFLTAERFTAFQAVDCGLVHRAVEPVDLEETVAGIVNALLMASPNAVREAKRLVREVSGASLDSALIGSTVERIANIRASDEGREGIQAFLEKRKPAWTN